MNITSKQLPEISVNRAAVSCSPDVYRLGGVGFGFWLTGKQGRAWHRCMGGAWVHGMVLL